MKSIILVLALVLSSAAFAEDAIVNNDLGYSVTTDGKTLSSESFLADVVYTKAKNCFEGKATMGCYILSLMSKIKTEHGSITSFSCNVKQNEIFLNFVADYESYGSDTYKMKIKRCR